jgi:hypothetical protein
MIKASAADEVSSSSAKSRLTSSFMTSATRSCPRSRQRWTASAAGVTSSWSATEKPRRASFSSVRSRECAVVLVTKRSASPPPRRRSTASTAPGCCPLDVEHSVEVDQERTAAREHVANIADCAWRPGLRQGAGFGSIATARSLRAASVRMVRHERTERVVLISVVATGSGRGPLRMADGPAAAMLLEMPTQARCRPSATSR